MHHGVFLVFHIDHQLVFAGIGGINVTLTECYVMFMFSTVTGQLLRFPAQTGYKF